MENTMRQDAVVGGEPVALTVHEERLVTSDQTERYEIGRVHLRKRIVVDEVTVMLPVRREVVDVVRVEADGSETVLDAAPEKYELRVEDRTHHAQTTGGATEPKNYVERDGGMVCFEERPVVTTEVFAVEHVRLELQHTSHTESQEHELRREEVEHVIDEA